MRRWTLVFVLIAVVTAGGLACWSPKLESISALPATYRSAIEIRPGPGGPGPSGLIRTRIFVSETPKPLVVPLAIRQGTPVIPAVMWAFSSSEGVPVQLLIDTGSPTFIEMPRSQAAVVKPWLWNEFGVSRAGGVFGDFREYSGMLRAVRIGDVTLSPVAVDVNLDSGLETEFVAGSSVLRLFRGVILDWPRRIAVLFSRLHRAGDAPDVVESMAQDARWVTVKWNSPAPDRAASRPAATQRAEIPGGPATAPADEFEKFNFACEHVTLDVRVGDEPRSACIDTGASYDAVFFTEAPLKGLGALFWGHGHGRSGLTLMRSLAEPLRIGRLVFDDVKAHVGVSPAARRRLSGMKNRPDLLIGAGLLRRQPVWFDFEAGCLRFWVGTSPVEYPFDVTPQSASTQRIEDFER